MNHVFEKFNDDWSWPPSESFTTRNIKYYQGYDRLKTRSSQLYQNNLTSDSLELEEVGEGQKGPNQYFGFGQKGRGGLQRQVRNHLDEKCFDKAALDLDGYKSNLEAEARVKHV